MTAFQCDCFRAYSKHMLITMITASGHQCCRACNELAHRQRRCMWLCWQEVMLMGITAPMYAVHAHARSWRLLDSLALLLSIAGALLIDTVFNVMRSSLNPIVHVHTKHLSAHQLATLASAFNAPQII